MYKVTPYLSLRYKILSIIQQPFKDKNKEEIKLIEKNSINEISEIPKILFSFEFQPEAYKEKILQEPKIYLNIVHSSEYSPPTDENGKPLTNSYDESKWRYIPTHFRYNNKKKSLSGKRCDFYDVIVNTTVIDRINQDETLKKSIISYITKKFCIHLESENYIRLYTDNVKIIMGKKYKSIKGLPEDFKILNKNKNLTKSTINNDPKNITQNVQQATSVPIAKNFMDENKINIPNRSENFPNTPTFYNIPKEKKNLKGNLNKKEESNQNPKLLIQEVKQPVKISFETEVVSDRIMKVKFDLNYFEEISINNIDLQISSDKIKINFVDSKYKEGEDYIPINMKFDFIVDPEKCDAKFNNSNKFLTVNLVRKID
jgi:hypothetical protein